MAEPVQAPAVGRKQYLARTSSVIIALAAGCAGLVAVAFVTARIASALAQAAYPIPLSLGDLLDGDLWPTIGLVWFGAAWIVVLLGLPVVFVLRSKANRPWGQSLWALFWVGPVVGLIAAAAVMVIATLAGLAPAG